MMPLLMMVIFLLVVTRVAGGFLRYTDRSLPRGRKGREALYRNPEPPEVAAPPPTAARPPLPETPLEALQRRFAAGEITVERYEREVGRLFGVKAEG